VFGWMRSETGIVGRDGPRGMRGMADGAHKHRCANACARWGTSGGER